MKIAVVIPVVTSGMGRNVIDDIRNNTTVPDHLIIINNTGDFFHPDIKPIPHYKGIRPATPTSVNDAWASGIMMALEKEVDLISIFNDDIRINRTFFEEIVYGATIFPNAGVFCPMGVASPTMVEGPGGRGFVDMKHREGWAFTMRSEVARRILPFPQGLRTFCGDDWIWHKGGMPWLRVMAARCFHYKGVAVKKLGVRQNLKGERRLLNKFL